MFVISGTMYEIGVCQRIGHIDHTTAPDACSHYFAHVRWNFLLSRLNQLFLSRLNRLPLNWVDFDRVKYIKVSRIFRKSNPHKMLDVEKIKLNKQNASVHESRYSKYWCVDIWLTNVEARTSHYIHRHIVRTKYKQMEFRMLRECTKRET